MTTIQTHARCLVRPALAGSTWAPAIGGAQFGTKIRNQTLLLPQDQEASRQQRQLLRAGLQTLQRQTPNFQKRAWRRDNLKGESIPHQGRKNRLQQKSRQAGARPGGSQRLLGLTDGF